MLADASTSPAADVDHAEVSPIDLSLLTGKNGEAEERFAVCHRAHHGYVPAYRPNGPAVPPQPDHLEQSRGAQPRIPPGERLLFGDYRPRVRERESARRLNGIITPMEDAFAASRMPEIGLSGSMWRGPETE